jgi:hypothetical protein
MGSALKRGAIRDVMIARANQHHRVFGQAQCGQRNRCSSIARRRFNDHFAADAFGPLRFDMGQMGGAGHHDRCGEPGCGRAAAQRSLKQRAGANQRQEGLGLDRAAARPQPGAAAAAQHNRMDCNIGHQQTPSKGM